MTSAPIVCQVTSVVSLVARSRRLRISDMANDMLPISANSDDQRQRRRRRSQRDDHAAKADQDGQPAPPADLLAEEEVRQRRDVDRPGHVEGHDVGKRQVDDGGVEQPGVGRREHHAQQLQTGPLDPTSRASPASRASGRG